MAFDKHQAPTKQIHEHHGKQEKKDHHEHDKKEQKKKPFAEGSNSVKGRNLDSYDKEQKIDKELGEKKPGEENTFH